MSPHPRRRLGVWIGLLGVVAGGWFVLPSAGASGSANLSPSTTPNTATTAKIAITTSGQHQPGATVVEVSGPGDSGTPFEDAAPIVSGQIVTATLNFVRFGVPAGPGNYTVRVCEAAASCNSTPTTESFSPLVVTGDAPSLASVTPIAVGAGIPKTSPLTMTLTGSGFASGATVTVTDPSRGDSGGVTLQQVQVSSPTTITAKLSTSGASPGPRLITVTNTDGQAATLTNRFVVDPAPTLAAPAKISLGQGAIDYPVTLHGSGIQPGAVVSVALVPAVTDGKPTFPTNGVSLDQGQHDSTNLPLRLSVIPNATPGDRVLTVTNPDGGSATLPVTVHELPGIAGQSNTDQLAGIVTHAESVTPSSVGQGAHGLSVKISGSGFVPGARVDLGRGVRHGAVTVSADGKTATVTGVSVDSDAATGTRQIKFVNGDGGVPAPNPSLTITAANLTAVQPASLQPGDSGEFISLSGMGYSAKTKVSIPGVTVTSVKYTGPTDPLKVNVDIPKKATPGLRDVTMTDETGGSAVCHNCFSIDDFKVKKVKPGTAPNTGPVTVTIRGRHIPSTVRADFTPTAGVLGQPVLFATHSRVSRHGTVYTGRVNFNGAAPTEYDVRLADRKHAGTCVCTVTVTAGKPAVKAVHPPTDLAKSDTLVPVEITGRNFSRGTVVSFSSAANLRAQSPVAKYVSPTKLVQWVDATFAVVGDSDVVLAAADKQTVTCTKCLTVHPVPTIGAVSPPKLPQGADKARITVFGTDFAPGSTLDFAGSITIEGKPVVTKTAIHAVVDVGAYATTGTVLTTVTGPYGAKVSRGDAVRVEADSPQPGSFFALPRSPVFEGRTQAKRLGIAGTSDVPADAVAALLDITAVGGAEASTLSIAPAGQSSSQRVMDVPSNGAAEQTVTATLGDRGAIAIRLSPAAARVSVHVVGYYRNAVGGSSFVDAGPTQLLDRALGAGVSTVPLPSGGAQPQGARAAVLQIAVTDASRRARLSVAPAGGDVVGGLQVMGGNDANGLFRVPAGDSSAVRLELSGGLTHATVTLVGWYVGGSGPTFTPLRPASVGSSDGQSVTAGQNIRISLTDSGHIPVNASAALLAITATKASAAALVTVTTSAGSSSPAARIPVRVEQPGTGFVVVPVDDSGAVTVSVSAGQTTVAVESIGYFR